MPDLAAYAYHAPDQATAHDPVVQGDEAMELQPPNQDVATHDVVSNPSRLKGAAGLTWLKERGT